MEKRHFCIFFVGLSFFREMAFLLKTLIVKHRTTDIREVKKAHDRPIYGSLILGFLGNEKTERGKSKRIKNMPSEYLNNFFILRFQRRLEFFYQTSLNLMIRLSYSHSNLSIQKRPNRQEYTLLNTRVPSNIFSIRHVLSLLTNTPLCAFNNLPLLCPFYYPQSLISNFLPFLVTYPCLRSFSNLGYIFPHNAC